MALRTDGSLWGWGSNYAIGDGQKDEKSLGFGVDVNLSLTAREAAES